MIKTLCRGMAATPKSHHCPPRSKWCTARQGVAQQDRVLPPAEPARRYPFPRAAAQDTIGHSSFCRGLPAAEQIITAQPDVQHVTLVEADQFFLLGCDGVWDVLSNQEACDFVLERLRPGASLNQIACELLDRCLASNPHDTRGIGCDNMTITIFDLGPGVS